LSTLTGGGHHIEDLDTGLILMGGALVVNGFWDWAFGFAGESIGR